MKVLVTGGTGMVGKAVQEVLPEACFVGSDSYNLKDFTNVRDMFVDIAPDYVIHLAAKVGGVNANSTFLGDFYYDNITINSNVLECAKNARVKKVVSLLSTCIYPDKVKYPLTEDQIHCGPPHVSNYAYAYAKRMLDIQSRAYRDQYGCNFITAVPNNLFGEFDNFHLEESHLIPALIRKIYEAKMRNSDVTLWGDGSPLREFTYSKDVAKILAFLLKSYSEPEPINIGHTKEYSVLELAKKVSNILEFSGNIIWNTDKPSGQYKKPSSNQKLLNLGWREEEYTDLNLALNNTCCWFLDNYPNIRGA